jgi:membrane dipeptidase
MFIVDAHLDLSMNALEWNRDLRQPVEAIRARERHLTDKPDRGRGTVSLPALRAGHVGLVVATQIGRYVAPDNPLPGWHSAEQAWAQTQGQLAWYRAMEDAGEMTAIVDRVSLDAHVARWQAATADERASLPVGYILSLEGADSLVSVAHLERAHAYGLRALGPAHYGPGRYAPGTEAVGPLEPQGRPLLAAMERLGIILDATHLSDMSFWEALEHFSGAVWASHNNCRALVPHMRQFTDEQLRALIARDAVIGAAFDAWMIVPDWVRGQSTPAAMGCTLARLVDHIDHICQLAGSARHVCIGSDLDGGFGTEQGPVDVDTIADLPALAPLLADRGYSDEDIDGIFSGNVLAFLRRHWGDA